MKRNPFFLNVLLAGVLALACLVILLLRVFSPDAILPEFNLTMVVALSLISLTLERYLAPEAGRSWVLNILLGAAALALLPRCAGLVTGAQTAELFLWGGAAFAVTLGLYTSSTQRLASGPASRSAPLVAALGLYLAAQCFAGILF